MLAARILQRLRSGASLRTTCRPDDMPDESSVRGWIEYDTDGFAEKYAKARTAGYLMLADDLLDIADDGINDWIVQAKADGVGEPLVDHEHVSRSRLRVDTRKWILAKMLPKLYGDKLQHTGADGEGPVVQRIERVIVDPKN
jgi:terminase small subunit-like protein